MGGRTFQREQELGDREDEGQRHDKPAREYAEADCGEAPRGV